MFFHAGLAGIAAVTLFLAFVPCVTGASTVMVSPSQSINDAISSAQLGDTVCLTSGTYQLVDKIIMKSGIHLTGESAANTIIRAGPDTGGSVSGKTSDGWIYCKGLTDIEISNLTFTSTASSTKDGGLGETRNCILLSGCTNVKIHDNQIIKYVYNDFVKCHSGNNIQVYDNSGQCGHDFVEFLSETKNSRAYNNNIVVQTNTGVRCDGASNIELDHNTLTGAGGTGWCLLEMENSLSNINIHHNIMHDFKGSSNSYAVAPVTVSGSVSVNNNVLWGVGSIAYGTTKDNNIDPADRSIPSWVAKGYGAGSSGTVAPSLIPPTAPQVVITPPITTNPPPITTNPTPITTNPTPEPAGGTMVSPTGSNSDQTVINNALEAVHNSGGGKVYLNAGTYKVDNTVVIWSNTILTGSPDAIIMVSPTSSQWFTGSTGIISCKETVKNVEISGFQINGNLGALPASYANSPGHDKDCMRCIILHGNSGDYADNIKIHDMKLYDSFSDGMYIYYAKNVKVYNNFISNTQHEGIFLSVVIGGEIYNNKIAGITSDCLRLDNSINCRVYDNVFFSYDGTNLNGAYPHGENGLQVGNAGSSHGYDASNKPTVTTNIEISNNTFANNGLKAIMLGSGSGNNVYVHDNKFIGVAELKTMGIPVVGNTVENVSVENPPTKEMSEKIFGSIFDILNTVFQDSAITNQTDDQIQYSVQKTTSGNIAGGVKIIGFRNTVLIDNITYMQDNNSTIVKSEAITTAPLDFWNQGNDRVEKTIDVNVKNGNATAVLTVKVRHYTTSFSKQNKKMERSYSTSTATFNDIAKAPSVYPTPGNISGLINIYPTYFEVYVPHTGLVKIEYVYGDNTTEHRLLIGERTNKDGIEYTTYSNMEDWTAGLNHTGDWVRVYGKFDNSKLNVTACTPYEDIHVSNFKITDNGEIMQSIAFWFYPTIGFLVALYLLGVYYWRRIWY